MYIHLIHISSVYILYIHRVSSISINAVLYVTIKSPPRRSGPLVLPRCVHIKKKNEF